MEIFKTKLRIMNKGMGITAGHMCYLCVNKNLPPEKMSGKSVVLPNKTDI